MVRHVLLWHFFMKIALGLLMVAGLVQASSAQNTTVTGKVTDPSNAAVVNAQVTLTNNASRNMRQATTNQEGLYTFPSVGSDTYTLTVEANNFARYENAAVIVGASKDQMVSVVLQLSSVSQSVTVLDNHESLEEVSTLDKTNTKLEDVPGSIQIISQEVLSEQGATMLRQGVTNSSGINYGGQDSKDSTTTF